MFVEKLIELLTAWWDYAAPGVILEPYQGGGVLRLGKYHRTLSEGFHWKWPFLETVMHINTCTTTMRIPPQTLTTKDGHGIVIGAVIKYAIKDIEPYICGVLDQVDVLADTTMGAIYDAIGTTSYEEIHADAGSVRRAVLKSVREQVNRYGFKVEAITFTDFGKVRSFRLVSEHGVNLAN